MTAIAYRPSPTRNAPSPVPLHQRSAPRDVSNNVWARPVDLAEIAALFGFAPSKPRPGRPATRIE